MKRLLALLSLLFLSSAAYADNYSGGGGGGGGGSGTVGNCASNGYLAYYATSGTTIGCTTTGLNVLTTLAAAVNATGGVISPTPGAPGDIIYWNGSSWVKLAGNASGTAFLQETSAGVPSWSSGAGVTSLGWSCPVTTGQTGAVTIPLGIGEVAESTGFTPTAAQCGAWFDVTGTTTATLPAIGGSFVSPTFYTIKNANTNGAIVTVAGGGANINYNNTSVASITLNGGQSVGVVINAANTAWSATGTVVGTAPIYHPGYISGDWYVAPYPGSGGSGAASSPQVASTVYCTTLWFPITTTIKSLGANFSIGNAAGHVSFALFNASNGRPTTLIDYVAPIATPSSAGSGSGSLNNTTDTIPAGVIFGCTTQDNATSSMYSVLVTASSTASGSSWVGNTNAANAIANNPAPSGITCTAASTCGTGYAAWSSGAFTWASFTTATWTNMGAIEMPFMAFQAN